MYRLMSIAGRFGLAVVGIAALFTVAGAEPARHLPLPLALGFWVLSVGTGLALAVAAAFGLTRWPGARRLVRWQLLGLAGVIGLLLYAPLSLALESAFPATGPPQADDGWLDRLEAAGGAGSLVAELLQAGPLYLLTWALLNAAPAAAVAPAAHPARARAALSPTPTPTAEQVHGASATASARVSAPDPSLPLPMQAVEALPGPPPAAAACAAEALGWPAAIGDEVLRVTADLHYLHVNTVLGRATVLGSLAAVEMHFGAAGLRIHRSHWVARRAIRRVARAAGGWHCELQDGQRLPISRRRVAEVRALLGSDFVLDAP
jgi:LytTr DNA-binding domain